MALTNITRKSVRKSIKLTGIDSFYASRFSRCEKKRICFSTAPLCLLSMHTIERTTFEIHQCSMYNFVVCENIMLTTNYACLDGSLRRERKNVQGTHWSWYCIFSRFQCVSAGGGRIEYRIRAIFIEQLYNTIISIYVFPRQFIFSAKSDLSTRLKSVWCINVESQKRKTR